MLPRFYSRLADAVVHRQALAHNQGSVTQGGVFARDQGTSGAKTYMVDSFESAAQQCRVDVHMYEILFEVCTCIQFLTSNL